ncbi:lytic polysaccharide monooxygenase [Catenuloplanes atrovinosus]|uniref:Chitin-binding protein n=1 Tax=Catenuloplanes atrovinosus TaxID=137266 RepID=A0AAE3YPW5_9ACTN|nr:lytic polysaccharide monooxygenase [Catenuloplanes atrovinosus]MDR7276159.1 chitin-binding protein [Catenuloplanes atrovinosus]
MRRPLVTLALLTPMTVAATTLAAPSPASAHGYISSPPSRQALCASGAVSNCGDIRWEPQSVEAPKGRTQCSGGVGRFAQLDDESKGWPATSVGSTVTFNWVLTARHATSTWQYFIGGTRIAEFNDGGAQPGATVRHTVNFAGRSGRQKVLAVWNIADTTNAFYACVDLQFGGGSTPPPATPTPTPTPRPTATTEPPPAGGTWAAGTGYPAGATVTYGGATYRCKQSHTAIVGWDPPNVPALWDRA